MLSSLLQGGIGIELWTMTEDILFDNIYVGHSLADAKALAAETFEIKKRLEVEADKAADPLDDEDIPSWKQDPVAFIRYKALVFLDLAQVDPVLALKTHPETGAALAGAVFTLFGMIGALFGLVGAQQKPITKVRLLNLNFNLKPFLILSLLSVIQKDRRSYAGRQKDRGDGTCRCCRWREEGRQQHQEAEVRATLCAEPSDMFLTLVLVLIRAICCGLREQTKYRSFIHNIEWSPLLKYLCLLRPAF